MTEKKKYVGGGKERSFNDGGTILNINISLSKMIAYAKENISPANNGETYIDLTIAGLRNENEYRETHTVYINEYKINKQKEKLAEEKASNEENSAEEDNTAIDNNDVPF